jgi:rhodanese-related sulfurtransferase
MTMSGINTITVEKLARLIGTRNQPILIDVRTDEDFAANPFFIPTSYRRDYRSIENWAAETATKNVIIICQRGAKLSHGAAAILRLQGQDAVSLIGGFLGWQQALLPLIPEASIPDQLPTGNTRWVTRHRPKIDRIVCPWLIRRFVDLKAEFLFVPPDDVAGVAERFSATPFDMPDGLWTHRGEGCTFDTMLEEFGLATPTLLHMAKIIRAADTDRLSDAPEAAGLLAISLGLSRVHASDLEQLEDGMIVYDALYRWCRDATDESHNWKVPSQVKS